LPLLREKAPWVPEAVEHWFQRACAKEPLERFQSADEMTEALQAAAGGAVLSKHKSFPEGRIAPETLVGYAAPTLATLQLDAAALSLARTQALAQPAVPLPPRAPIPIAITTGERTETPSQWKTPIKSLRLVWLGLGFGVLAVVAMALTLSLLADNQRQSRAANAPRRSASPSAAIARPTSELAATRASPTSPADERSAGASGGSSVAAESAATSATPLPRPQLPTVKKPAGAAVARPKQAGETPPAPITAQSSDLGF
jgi:serine/threonine-protein kinase